MKFERRQETKTGVKKGPVVYTSGVCACERGTCRVNVCGGKVSLAEETEASRSHSPLLAPPHSGCHPYSAARCCPEGSALGWGSGDSQIKHRHAAAPGSQRDSRSGATGPGAWQPPCLGSVRSSPDVGGGWWEGETEAQGWRI